MTEQAPNRISCDDLAKAIEEHKILGYRLDMISPADNPREALVSKDALAVRLVSTAVGRGFGRRIDPQPPPEGGTQNDWIKGRAGMEYRDLIPDRLDGKVIASHIRLAKGGAVDDYVHYHKVEFQVIYCLKGRIKVVYEDQGPPFWLEAGDWVLQPPEIRHRVLECTAGAEVMEVSIPAEHETWVDHDMILPTADVRLDRLFGGQRFVRHIARNSTTD